MKIDCQRGTVEKDRTRNRTKRRLCAVLLVVFGTVTACSVLAKMSESVVDESAGLNGDFEITRTGRPVNWHLYSPRTVPDSDFDLVIDRENFKSGKQSLKFVVRECSEVGGWHSPGFTRQVPADPGATYIVSFWVKNQGTEFKFTVGGVNAFDGEYGVDVRSSESIEDWKKMEYEFRMPEEYKQLRIELNVLKPGTFWIDRLNVEKVEGPAA